MTEEMDDLIFFCSLYHGTYRSTEAIATLKEIIDLDPVFDKPRCNLFQAVYKQVIDALRNNLATISSYLENESALGNVDRVKALERRKEVLCDKLLRYCKEAIDIIDHQLLSRSPDTNGVIFFTKLKADLYRYVAEYSDDTEAVSASSTAETCYGDAIQLSMDNLNPADPIRLSVILNAAVFKIENRKDVESATEMLKNAIWEFQENHQQLPKDTQNEAISIIDLMNSNLANWTGAPDDTDE